MLKLNLVRLFKIRGITKPNAFLSKLGINYVTASNIINGKVTSLKFSHTEKLCKALKCTPNDLYEWVPDKKNPDKNSPLASLVRNHDSDLNKIAASMSTLELENLIASLKKK
jgi:DNA-binding Xre family transcriptional regulator